MKIINRFIVLLGFALAASIANASIITYNINAARAGSAEAYSSYSFDLATMESTYEPLQISNDSVNMTMSFLLDSSKYFDYGPDEFANFDAQDTSFYPAWLTSNATANGDVVSFSQITDGTQTSMYSAVGTRWSSLANIALYSDKTWDVREYYDSGALKSVSTHWQVNQIYADVSDLELALFDGKEIATRADGILGSYIYMHYQISTINYSELGQWTGTRDTDIFAGSIIDSIDVLVDGQSAKVPEPAPLALLCLGLGMMLYRRNAIAK